MKFTSHERDRDPTGFGNDVDYMHARYYLHRTGRFLSPDSILGRPDGTQSWNRSAYVMGSPTNTAERSVLWILEGKLEKMLVELLKPEYKKLVEAARTKVDGAG